MVIDSALVSRLQFAFTITFHIIFPAISIGLALFICVMEAMWLKTRNTIYIQICKFWTKILALTFGMGVVSGLVMEYQLGTNFAGFSHDVGNVLGALFTYEVLTAFFIEAGFLGVMLFGWNRVNEKLHFLATLLVAIGTTVSTFWILSANSWMQTPAGFEIIKGKFIVTNYWDVVFNPSFIPRLFHMLTATYISTGFVIAGIAAFYLRKGLHQKFAQKCLVFSLGAMLVLTPVQILLGDWVGLKVHHYQPIKTAAMEGIWETTKGAPLLLFAIPDQKHQKNIASIGIPKLASLINTHDLNGKMVGLKSVPLSDQPPVALVFYSFRVMVGCGLLMLLLAVIGCWKAYRRKLSHSAGFLRIMTFASPLGLIALWTGWITAEVGRQPWIVYHFIRTNHAASKLPFHEVLASLLILVVVYGIIFGFFYFLFFVKLLRKGPTEDIHLHDQSFYYMAGDLQEHHK